VAAIGLGFGRDRFCITGSGGAIAIRLPNVGSPVVMAMQWGLTQGRSTSFSGGVMADCDSGTQAEARLRWVDGGGVWQIFGRVIR